MISGLVKSNTYNSVYANNVLTNFIAPDVSNTPDYSIKESEAIKAVYFNIFKGIQNRKFTMVKRFTKWY